MREAPSDFTTRLDREFGGRLRIRWSVRHGEWHIEQRIARGQVAGHYVADNDDDAIRARDGYAYLMSVREGDRMPCPIDGSTVRVPVMGTGEAHCDYCKYKGREGRFPAAYFPLDGDALIQYLRRLDPILGWRETVLSEIDSVGRRSTEGRERDLSNTIEASTKDHWRRIVGIPGVGYTGKERMWSR